VSASFGGGASADDTLHTNTRDCANGCSLDCHQDGELEPTESGAKINPDVDSYLSLANTDGCSDYTDTPLRV